MKKLVFVEGMSCGHCTMKVQSNLGDIPGVAKVEVDLFRKTAMVEGEGEGMNDAAMRHAVAQAGYRVVRILGRH
ncbi:MAG: heavy-metal-associated domain-containing protein [Spirochaetota bacterium]